MIQKYFIAIVPPEPLYSDINEIKQSISNKYSCYGALQSPPHITLHLPFNWQEEKENKLIECLQNFKFKFSFNINASNFSCFKPRVVFINIKQNNLLCLLQKNLVFHVKKNINIFNQYDDKRGFHPHITLAFRDLKRQKFDFIWEEYKDKIFNESFICNQMVLLKKEKLNWKIYKEFNFNL